MTTTICKSVMKETTMQPLIDETINQLLWQVAKINLHHCESAADMEDLCTVYTTFSGGYNIRFAFCAERTLMQRMSENMAEEPVTEQDDIEEYMKEFINVICGHIVATVFRLTKISARFHVPRFADGCYLPDEDDRENHLITTYYISDFSEAAMLLNDYFSLVTC